MGAHCNQEPEYIFLYFHPELQKGLNCINSFTKRAQTAEGVFRIKGPWYNLIFGQLFSPDKRTELFLPEWPG